MWGRGRKAKASPILVRFKSLLRWSKGKLRNRKLERIAQGPTAAKGQSWLESLAVPTQHPINAGKMDLMGFMSQKLKETWQMIGSKASSISQMWKSSPTEGQGPAKSEASEALAGETRTKGSCPRASLLPPSRDPQWGGRGVPNPKVWTTHTRPLPSRSLLP